MLKRALGRNNTALEARIETEARCNDCVFPKTVDATPEAVWVTEEGGETIYANPSFARLLGTTEASLSTEMLLEHVHPDDRLRVRTALITGAPCSTVPRFRVLSPTGVRWVEIRRFRVEDTRPARMAHIALDLTDHVLNEAEIHQQREIETSLLETVHAAVIMLDLDGRIVRMNRFLEELSGVTLGAARGLELAAMLCRDRDVSAMREVLARTRNGERVRGQVVAIVGGGGGEHEIEWHTTLLVGPAGEATGILATGHDITARLAVERTLREREALLRQISDTIQEAFWLVSLDRSQLFHVSAAVEQILGVTREAMYANPTCFLMAIHPDDRAVVTGRMAQQANAPTPQPYEQQLRFVGPDGAIRWVWNRVFPVVDDDGVIRRVAGISADVTSRKEAEQQLAELTSTLEQRVEQRTHDLAVANAALAVEMREKEVLLRELHHRVKNNMQVISSLIYLQSRSIADPAVLSLLDQLSARIRAMSLAHEVLYRSSDVARLDASAYIKAVVNSVSETHREYAPGVRVDTDVEVVTLELDVGLPCGLIVTELVSNAYKHAFRGRTGGRIVVSLRPAPSDTAILSVEDDGVGIPEGARGGAGLGLLLVRALAGQIHGDLQIERRVGTSVSVVFASPGRRAAQE